MPDSNTATGGVPRRFTERIPELDGLRGVLAWVIVAVHLMFCSGFRGPQLPGSSVLIEIAEGAVDVFMLLSGFAITRLLLVKREPYRLYLRRRVCRIVPAYWVALALAVSLNGWFAANLRRLPATSDGEALAMICDLAASRFWTDLGLHLFLLHGLAPVQVLPFAPYTFLGVAWSLSLEEQFYALAPLLLGLALASRIGFAGIAAVATVGLGFGGYWTIFMPTAFLPVKLGFFVAGGLTFYAAHRAVCGSRWPLYVLAPSCIAAALWAVGSGRILEAAFTAAVWLVVIVAALIQRFGVVSQLLNSAPLQYLGRVSYSTYLFHVPVITIVQTAIWRWINPADQLQLFWWTICGATAGTLLVAHLSWRFIERPFQMIGRGLR